MKQNRKFTALTLILLAAVLAGCSKADSNGDDNGSLGPAMNSYVWTYIKPVDLFAGFMATGQNEMTIVENPQQYHAVTLNVRFYPANGETYGGKWLGGEYAGKYWEEHCIRSTPKSTGDIIYDEPYNPAFNRIYDSLCVAHHDTEFSKVKKHYSIHLFSIPATYRRLTLDVVSNTDYDAAHPAGTSLADILTVRFPSAKEFIELGYGEYDNKPEEYDWSRDANGLMINMPLTRMNAEYRKLMGGWFRMNFTKAPDATSTHTFTIIYRDEDGRELTTTMLPLTIKAAE